MSLSKKSEINLLADHVGLSVQSKLWVIEYVLPVTKPFRQEFHQKTCWHVAELLAEMVAMEGIHQVPGTISKEQGLLLDGSITTPNIVKPITLPHAIITPLEDISHVVPLNLHLNVKNHAKMELLTLKTNGSPKAFTESHRMLKRSKLKSWPTGQSKLPSQFTTISLPTNQVFTTTLQDKHWEDTPSKSSDGESKTELLIG